MYVDPATAKLDCAKFIWFYRIVIVCAANPFAALYAWCAVIFFDFTFTVQFDLLTV